MSCRYAKVGPGVAARMDSALAHLGGGAVVDVTEPDLLEAGGRAGNDVEALRASMSVDLRVEDRPSLGAVDKALVVLAEVISGDGPIGLAELTRRTGLAKATVHRLIGILQAHEMIDQHDRKYLPGHWLADVGRPTDGMFLSLLRRLSTPHLVELYQSTGETVSLGVLAGGEVHYLQRICGHRSVRTPSYSCDRAPAYRTAIGKVLLAHNPIVPYPVCDDHGSPAATPTTITSPAALSAELCQVRRNGIAYNREEYISGVVCVAAPVPAGQGQRPPVGIAVSGKAGQLDVAKASEQLRRAAFTLSMAIRRATTQTARVGPPRDRLPNR